MLRKLLGDGFQMAVREESRTMAIYALQA